MAYFALCLFVAAQPQAIDLAQGQMPELQNTLILDVPRRPFVEVGHSQFQLALQDGLPETFKAGDSYAGATWKSVKKDEEGKVFSSTGSSPIYAEWEEPTSRKVLAQLIFGGNSTGYFIDGERQPSNHWGEIPLQLTPLNLEAGRHSIISGSAMSFLFFPVKSQFVFNPRSAVVADIPHGNSETHVASVTAINCTDVERSVTVKAQIGSGPIVLSVTPALPAMNSRIVRFRYRAGKDAQAGPQKLKLWVDDDLPSIVDVKVVEPGEPVRRTYVGKSDGMVRSYAVLPSSGGTQGKPLVGFLYGGLPGEIEEIARAFKAPSGYTIVIPGIRGASWSGLAGRDALEALDDATRHLKTDRSRTYLTGHSMGGHGAYLLASLNPGAFAGVGTSAGWISLKSYLGKQTFNAEDPIERMFDLAQTEQKVENRFDQLAKVGNFAVVHGDKDTWVPLAETNRMKDGMVKRSASFTIFEKAGLDHFWEENGANQYDYPPLVHKLLESPRRGDGKLARVAKVAQTWTLGLSKRTAVVYGTRGSASENFAALQVARIEEFDLREFLRMESKTVPDTVPISELKGWNVTLIGNARTNTLWKHHPTASQRLAEAQKKGVRVDGWMIQARKGKDVWSAIGGTDTRALIAVSQLPTKWHEYPFPEWVLFDRSKLENGFGWVVAAGFNDGTQAWRETGNLAR